MTLCGSLRWAAAACVRQMCCIHLAKGFKGFEQKASLRVSLKDCLKVFLNVLLLISLGKYYLGISFCSIEALMRRST